MARSWDRACPVATHGIPYASSKISRMLGSEIGSMEIVGSRCSSVGGVSGSGATGGSVEFCPVVCSAGASVCSSCGGVTRGAVGVASDVLVTVLGSEASVLVSGGWPAGVSGVTFVGASCGKSTPSSGGLSGSSTVSTACCPVASLSDSVAWIWWPSSYSAAAYASRICVTSSKCWSAKAW